MRKLALILTIMLWVTSCLGCGFTALADTNASKFDGTDVLEDLNGSIIAGQAFDLNNFVYTLERETQVITFAEYGYHYDGNKQSNYALYVYVYNPSGKEIQAERNTVSLATVYEDGKAIDYDKFTLILLDVSDGKHANLFYKFKIADVSKILARVSANSNVRRYDVAELELNYGAETSKAFDVGNYYEYSGFAKGYGADETAESTLTCVSDSVDTLKLNVNSTYYRYNNGVNTQSNLSSVYFGIPNKTLELYGKLQQIKANWYETNTAQQIVLTDKSLYSDLYKYLGYDTQAMTVPLNSMKINDGRVPTLLFGGDEKVISTDGTAIYSFAFDGKYHTNTDSEWLENKENKWSNQLRWLFYSDDGNVSYKQVLEQAKAYTDLISTDNLLLGKYANDLFVQEVDSNRQYGWQGTDGSGIVIDADSVFDINGFAASNNFINWFYSQIYKDLETKPITDIEPIYVVQDDDIVGTPEAIAKRLLINEATVSDFITDYNANKVAGRKTVLFRFAVTDYTAKKLYIDTGKISFNRIAEVGYVAEQTVFLDFDIIWLKFVKEAQSTVIPCVSDPIDVFSGLTPPLETQIPWWVWLIVACIVLLALILLSIWVKPIGMVLAAVLKGLWYAIKYLFIGLHYVIASPVYLIAWIVEKARERRGG